MLPTSIPQTNPKAPIQRMSVAPDSVDAIRRLNDASYQLYSNFSPYDAGGDGNGVRQPYVWTSLNDSNDIKYIKQADSWTCPVGSITQDSQRIGNFFKSCVGSRFSDTQYLLQSKNVFNETQLWDKKSIINATENPGMYPVRHIDTSGGLLGIALGGLLSAVGISSDSLTTNAPPPGTATAGLAALSQEVQMGGNWPAKGLMRYQTGASAKINFSNRFGSSTSAGSVGFLESLANSLISQLTRNIPSSFLGGADWQYRVEYSKSSDVWNSFYSDPSNLLGYSIVKGVPGYIVRDIQPFYPGDNATETDNWYFGKSSQQTFTSLLDAMVTDLASAQFDEDKNYRTGKPNQIVTDYRDGSTTLASGDGDITDILGETAVTRIASAVTKWNSLNTPYDSIKADFYTKRVMAYKDFDGDTSAKTTNGIKSSDKQTLVSKKFPGANQADIYNTLRPIASPAGVIPTEILDSNRTDSADIIFFYFYDLVNSIYIPFRATINGINENTSVEWEEVQYMGRADKVYMYKGFVREISFGFTVVANSVAELAPMWTRINYLSGLTRPSNYTQGGVGSIGQFVYPPMITFRIGDLFVDQPAIIRSYGMNIPEDALWETTPSNTDYGYLVENGVARVSSKQPVAQVPMKADITITMALIEKERSVTNGLHYFVKGMSGFEPPDPFSPTNQAAVAAASRTFNTPSTDIFPSSTALSANSSNPQFQQSPALATAELNNPDFTKGKNLPPSNPELPTFGQTPISIPSLSPPPF